MSEDLIEFDLVLPGIGSRGVQRNTFSLSVIQLYCSPVSVSVQQQHCVLRLYINPQSETMKFLSTDHRS